MEFICDFCNSVVSGEDVRCSNCGLEFSNTRCPLCGLVGPAKIFKNGCPTCKKLDRKRRKEEKFEFITLKPDETPPPTTHQNTAVPEQQTRKLPLGKFLIVILGISILLVWYTTYIELYR